MPTSLICLATLLPGGGDTNRPAAPHAVAYVTDSLSHGQVGDGFLSLNEAIQLHNQTLSVNQLSAAEQMQVQLIPGTGPTTNVTWVDFDGTSTPTITIERDLDPVIDTTYGLYLRSVNEPTVLDFSTPGVLHGFRSSANSFELKDMILSGGPYGIDLVQTDVSGHAGLVLNRVRFEGQTQFAVRVATTTANGFGKLHAEDCTFLNAPTAIVWNENVAGRNTIFELVDCVVSGAAHGLDVELGAGGLGRYTLDRLTIDATQTGVRLLRPTGGNRNALLETQHIDVRAPSCVRIDGSPTGWTWAFQFRMWHLRCTGAGGTALSLGALGDNVYGTLEDLTLDGSSTVLSGGGSQALRLDNARCRNGNITFGTTVNQALSTAWTAFEQCQIATVGTAPVTFTDCSFRGGSLAGTAAAPALCTSSYVQNAGNHVVQTGSLPQPQLGTVQLSPDVVQIGTTATFQVDLPPGLFAVLLLGFTDPAPILLAQPLHVYSMPSATFTLPGVYRAQQGYGWPIPNFPIFVGLDLVLGAAVLPDPNVSAPAVQVPPGRRFALR
jgi:hypothetical protein